MARMNTVFLNDYFKKEKDISQREGREATLDGLYHLSYITEGSLRSSRDRHEVGNFSSMEISRKTTKGNVTENLK